MNERRPTFKGRVMPQNPLPPYVLARLRRFPSMCALARFISNPYVAKMCPDHWVQWAKRSRCWRHRLKGAEL
jgi:hypothetical protein